MIRLAHFLAQQGIASRRKAEVLIAEGKVSVNGKVIRAQGVKVDPGKDNVVVTGRGAIHRALNESRVVLFYKPRNVMVTKQDPEGRPTIFDYLKDLPKTFNYAGRLDFDSEGLVLLANEGRLIQELTHPSFEVTKIYQVKVSIPPDGREGPADFLKKLKQCLPLSDGPAQAEEVLLLKKNPKNCWFQISLHEGRNRIVRRMCEDVGLKVLRLKRVAIGPYRLGALKPGEFREIRPNTE